MKDWNADKNPNASANRWIACEAAFVGLLFVLGLASVLYNIRRTQARRERRPLHRTACDRVRAVGTARSRRVVASGPAPIRATVANQQKLKLSYTEQSMNI